MPEWLAEQSGGLAVALIPGKGRGVVARRRFARGEVIETAPVIVIPQGPGGGPVLDGLAYDWAGDSAVALGYGSLYNHSLDPNARYARRLDEGLLEFVALRDIEPGEEVVVNYNGDPRDRTPVVFADKYWRP